jgi:hypothetical protein
MLCPDCLHEEEGRGEHLLRDKVAFIGGLFAMDVLQRTAAPGVVIGRFAVLTWVGDKRQQAYPKDLDFAVLREDLPKITSFLEDFGAPVKHLTTTGGLQVSLPDGICVSFIDCLSNLLGDFAALFSEAIRYSVDVGTATPIILIADANLPAINPDKLPVVAPEYLIVMNFITGELDTVLDAKRLLESDSVEVDIDLVRDILRRHAPAKIDDFEWIIRDIRHLARSG